MSMPVYILAGGASSRMGFDKGLMKIGQKMMIEYILETCQQISNQLTIVSSNTAYETFGYPVIQDKNAGRGPAQGVITVLENSPTDRCLILTCDMPCLNGQILQELLNSHSEAEIVCYTTDFLYPFPGLYASSILPEWQRQVLTGQYKLQQLLRLFRLKSLAISDVDVLLNVNTPKDAQLLKERWEK